MMPTIPTIPGFPLGLPIPIPTTLPTPGASLLSHDPPPDYATLAAPPPGSTDASGALTMPFLRQEVEAVYREVLAGAGQFQLRDAFRRAMRALGQEIANHDPWRKKDARARNVAILACASTGVWPPGK